MKGKDLLTELLNPGTSPPSTHFKILLLGLRDAYNYHHDLLGEEEPFDEAGRLKHYYEEGLRFWKSHDRERAMYYLGGALYHLQDAWLDLARNPNYERYLEKRISVDRAPLAPEPVPATGISPEMWVSEAMRDRDKFDRTSLDLARRTETAGAGLLLQFFAEVS